MNAVPSGGMRAAVRVSVVIVEDNALHAQRYRENLARDPALQVVEVGPLNGQIAEVPNARTIRYYTTIGLLDGPSDDPRVAHHWRVATDERRTADEWGVLIRGLLGARRIVQNAPAEAKRHQEELERKLRAEEEAKKGPSERKTPPEFGSDKDFQLIQALNQLKGRPVAISKTQVVENKEEKKEN